MVLQVQIYAAGVDYDVRNRILLTRILILLFLLENQAIRTIVLCS
jgi:hypothetical protein